MLDDVQQALLRDMLDSVCAIRRYLAGVTREVFLNDVEKQDAVLRRFEIIGEAASRLSPDTQALFPGVPFRAMRGMRNIIAHDYGDMDLDQVWKPAVNCSPACSSWITKDKKPVKNEELWRVLDDESAKHKI